MSDALGAPPAERSKGPRRVVALGGGTGMPAVMRGMRSLVASQQLEQLTAVVTMADDGGSSGRLRREQGVLPPGDVRNCLVALSEDEELLAGLFQHRYDSGSGLNGHSLGNLILAALTQQTGSFLKAVEVSSRVLRTVGRILPKTLEDVSLQATLEDGTRLQGESVIGACAGRIAQLDLVPASARATPGVVEAIESADLIVLGPGSLYTSIVPHLLVQDIAGALRRARGVRVLVANLVGGRGESAGLLLEDHLRAIESHAGGRVVDALLVHEGSIDRDTARRYLDEGSVPLSAAGLGSQDVCVVRRNLVASGPLLRHGPAATADGLIETWRKVASVRTEGSWLPTSSAESRSVTGPKEASRGTKRTVR